MWKFHKVIVLDYTWVLLLCAVSAHTTVTDGNAFANPVKWHDGSTMSWQHGRQLASYTKDGSTISFTYNDEGIRTSKTVNGITTNYSVIDGTLRRMTSGDNTLQFVYGNGLSSVIFNGTEYWYVYNAQNDVIGLINTNGEYVVEYTYDAWGKPLSKTGTLADTLGTLNPFRYRGYIYDEETGLYYVSSRYYDPAIGRWLNADGAYDTNQGVLGYDMYAYCINNPANRIDPDGGCSRFLGFLWKIDCKQVSCLESKNYVKPKSVEPEGTYNKGQGYVYIVKEDQLDEIMEDKEDNVVVILDDRTAPDPNMQIQDSYKITKKKQQKEISEMMIAYNEANPVEPTWSRTLDSLVFEWRLHNNIYSVGMFQGNTEDCDFNNSDEGKGYWDFFAERVLK